MMALQANRNPHGEQQFSLPKWLGEAPARFFSGNSANARILIRSQGHSEEPPGIAALRKCQTHLYGPLVRMFEQALKAVAALEPNQQGAFVERLERVRREGHNWGWGVGDDMDDLVAEYGFAKE